ncbi:cysteine-rich KTR domain-containing protein [Anaerosphaera multitolerans]|uniref:Conjugal transfer protein n=1 Tax=Anaerosphaera multitolerans TaxID=2487351 RepID=A0A437S7J1_9FIRM|nr:cysteine-rich KTR domain-containing protein [Anaerosphaera multitolerans]RVU55026.1 conjugal transfer protein [Anaerosphaera multitolerans]
MTKFWLCCPICQKKTRVKVMKSTVLKNFPLYCPKCKKEVIVSMENFKLKTVEPDTKIQSQ